MSALMAVLSTDSGAAWSLREPVARAAPIAAPDDAPLPLYTADLDHSSLEFTVRHLRLTKVRGVFHKWSAALSYDPEDVLRSSVTVVIDVASLDTDNESRDRDLRSAHFFDADRFPTAVFQSTDVRRTDEGFVARGELRIRDVARQVEIPFVHTGSFESPSGRSVREGFEGSITITRADFGVVHEGNILETSGAIGKDVTLEIELSAIHLKWGAFPFPRVKDGVSLGESLLVAADSLGSDAAVRRFQKLMASSELPPTSMQDMAILAARLRTSGRGALAGNLIKLYAGSHDSDAQAQLVAADVLAAAGSREDALQYYRKAAALSPDMAEAPERIRVLMGHSHDATLFSSPSEPPG